MAAADGISCEVIDLRTLLPWDVDTVGEPDTTQILRAVCVGFRSGFGPHTISGRVIHMEPSAELSRCVCGVWLL